MNYKKCFLKVTDSQNYKFWFKLHINGIPYGDHRSEEEAYEYGIFVINKSIDVLNELDQTIVIDDNSDWYTNNTYVVNAFQILTGYSDYGIINAKFEGYYIKDFLKQFN